MNSSMLSGCCAVTVIYRVGNAEGVVRKNKLEFLSELSQILNRIYTKILLITTIHQQQQERALLEELGFVTFKSGKIFFHVFEDKSKLKENIKYVKAQLKPIIKYKTLFKGKVLRADIQEIIFDNPTAPLEDKVSQLNDFYKLNDPKLYPHDIDRLMRSKFYRDEFERLRKRIYTYVVANRKERII